MLNSVKRASYNKTLFNTEVQEITSDLLFFYAKDFEYWLLIELLFMVWLKDHCHSPPNSDDGGYYIANSIANSLTRLVFKLLTLGVNCNKFVAWKYSCNR